MSNELKFEPAVLVLADGRAFRGRSVGAAANAVGALHFDTDQSGYFEAVTAADHSGALLSFTSPHVGNTGVADVGRAPTASGVIMRDPSRIASHWDSAGEFEPYLRNNGVVAISHIDTRALIRHAGAHHRTDANDANSATPAPVVAGIFTGERARAPIAELVETVNATAKGKGL